MKTFTLVRNEDESGVSGTGEVAEGVQFANGKCVMCWNTKTSSVAVYENVQDLINIHGHNGKTIVAFDNGEIVTDVKYPEDRGDRAVVIKSTYPEFVGRVCTLMEEPAFGNVEVVFDKIPGENFPREQTWTVSWLRLL